MRAAYNIEMFRRRHPDWEPFAPETREPPWSALDLGVIELVRLLWLAGFNPTDSGDGESKPADERTIDGPHVVLVVCDPGCLYAEANRLHQLLHRAGVDIDQIEGTGPSIEASYDPAMGAAILLLCGVNDQAIAKAMGLPRKVPT